MKKLLVLSLLLVILLGASWLLLSKAPPREEFQLSDGSRVALSAVTVGTNHIAGSGFRAFVNRLPTPIADLVGRLSGQANLGRVFRTSETNLVLWIEQFGPANGSRVNTSLAIRRPSEGAISGELDYYNLNISAGQSNALHHVGFRNWPRRSPNLECVVFERDSNWELQEIGSFTFKNPQIANAPIWTPESLPATKTVGDLTLTLEDFASGTSMNSIYRRTAEGKTEIAYPAAKPNEEPKAMAHVKIKSPRGTNEVWEAYNADLRDATGNRARPGSRSHDYDLIHFSPTLWPDENAWKLRLHVKRKSGFTQGELITFSNVPLPAVGFTNNPTLTNVTMNIKSTLAEIQRRPPHDENQKSSSMRDYSGIRLNHDTLNETNQLDLVSLTLQPSGEIIPNRGASWSSAYHEYRFESIPLEATHIDLVFSIQKARFAEFLVAPNWRTNEYVYQRPE